MISQEENGRLGHQVKDDLTFLRQEPVGLNKTLSK